MDVFTLLLIGAVALSEMAHNNPFHSLRCSVRTRITPPPLLSVRQHQTRTRTITQFSSLCSNPAFHTTDRQSKHVH